MRKTCLLLWLLMVVGVAGFAQQTAPLPTADLPPSSPALAATQPVPDSVRQALHKLFRRGRLFGTISAISGGLIVGGATSYIVRDDDDWRTGVDLALGANALFVGVSGMVHFSRRREKEIIAAWERGQPLPPYVANWLPLVVKKPKK